MKKGGSATKGLKLAFVLGTAAILLVALAISSVLEYIFVKFELQQNLITLENEWYMVLIFSATSILIGLGLAFILGRIIFKPMTIIADGLSSLSEGDFSKRIHIGGYDSMESLSESFNKLATELEKTEILRNDFVNEFSHEMKTPIVSISGLIALLKDESLPVDKRKQYIEIIDKEVTRLTEMTSNALYLSKIEAQEILTNKTSYNLSEQIRECILLLERKWTRKGLTPVLEFDEHTITANEDMLKQVFVNLIDNAIKFSDENTEFMISIDKAEQYTLVNVSNYGIEIPESEQNAIFGKFYQCDKSRSTDGNGIGLSIVKNIVTLHDGTVSVTSENGMTTFTVSLKDHNA